MPQISLDDSVVSSVDGNLSPSGLRKGGSNHRADELRNIAARDVDVQQIPAPIVLVVRLGCITVDEMRRMRESGAVGDILGSFFSVLGEPVAEWIEERVVGVSRRDIAKIPQVVAMASERSKSPAVLGALRSGLVNSLVTTVEMARKISQLSD